MTFICNRNSIQRNLLLIAVYCQFRARIYGEKLSRVEGSLAYPSYPRRANFSYISLHGKLFTPAKKIGWARRVTSLTGSPFFHINTLSRPAGSTRSRRDNQSMRKRCWLGQRGQRFSHNNARWSWLDWEGDPVLPGTNCLHTNGAFSYVQTHATTPNICNVCT